MTLSLRECVCEWQEVFSLIFLCVAFVLECWHAKAMDFVERGRGICHGDCAHCGAREFHEPDRGWFVRRARDVCFDLRGDILCERDFTVARAVCDSTFARAKQNSSGDSEAEISRTKNVFNFAGAEFCAGFSDFGEFDRANQFRQHIARRRRGSDRDFLRSTAFLSLIREGFML